jgi:GDP-4-dehydro-6-deoxy-D-mannose reductase
MHLTSRSVLVTGAGGFVGRYLVAALKERPGLSVTAAGGPDTSLDGIEPLDIAVPESVAELIRRIQPTDVFHLAAVTSKAAVNADPAKAWDINVNGTANVAHAILRAAPACRLIFVGSSEVYGRSFLSGLPLDESAQLDPMSAYGETKAAADELVARLSREGLRAVRLRPFNHFGRGQRADFVVPAFADQIARIERGLQAPEIRVGDLSPRRDFLDVRDVVAAYLAVLGASDRIPNGIALNVASGAATSVQEILESLLGMASRRIAVMVDPTRLRAAEVPVAYGSANALEQLTGWRPARPMRESLRDTLDAFRAAYDSTEKGNFAG